MSSYSDGVFYQANTRVNPFIVSSVRDLAPGVSIDFGCGMGTNSRFLKSREWDTYVVEQEDIPISRLRQFLSPDRIFHEDIRRLDFGILPKADLVLCNYVLQHFSIEEAHAFINNLRKCTSGTAAAVISIFERPGTIDSAHLIKLMDDSGFRLVNEKHWERIDRDHGPVHTHVGYEGLWTECCPQL